MIETGDASINAALVAICTELRGTVTLNDPLTSRTGDGRGGKAESQHPGYQQAAGLVASVVSVLERTARDVKSLNDDWKPHATRTDAAHSIGGVDVSAQDVGSCYRPHKPVRIDVDGAMRHMRKLTFVSNLPEKPSTST